MLYVEFGDCDKVLVLIDFVLRSGIRVVFELYIIREGMYKIEDQAKASKNMDQPLYLMPT